MSGYTACHLDEIAAEQWPYWAPIRHHFDIRSFGINAWRGADGDFASEAVTQPPAVRAGCT